MGGLAGEGGEVGAQVGEEDEAGREVSAEDLREEASVGAGGVGAEGGWGGTSSVRRRGKRRPRGKRANAGRRKEEWISVEGVVPLLFPHPVRVRRGGLSGRFRLFRFLVGKCFFGVNG